MSTRPWPHVLSLVCLVFLPLLAPEATAGGSLADYERAARLEQRFGGKLRGGELESRWLDAETLLFRRSLAGGGSRFVVARGAGGPPAEAFDHAVVASALGTLLGNPVDADRLPLEILDRAGTIFRGVAQDRLVAIDAETGEVSELDAGTLPSLRLPLATRQSSSGGGRDTAILFVNSAAAPVQLLWIDHAGLAKPYATLASGAKHRQHTFPGHLWRAVAADGRVLGSWVGRPGLGVAVITDTPTERTADPAEAPKDPGRSPDGHWVAFLRDHDVWLRRLPGGRETRLSTDGTPTDRYTDRMRWSPDARTLMVVQERPAQERTVHVIDVVPKDGLQPRLVGYPYLKPGDRIAHPRPRLFDVRARKPIPFDEALYPTPWSISHLAFTPDGTRFTFLYNQRGHQVLRLVELDVKGGTARALIDESSSTFIDYSQKTWLRRLGGGDWLWMSERDGRNHIYRIDGTSGSATPITTGAFIVREVLEVDEDAGTLSFSAYGAYAGPGSLPPAYRADRPGRRGSRLAHRRRRDPRDHADPDGALVVDRWSRVDQPPVIELRRARDGTLLTELARADAAALAGRGVAPPGTLRRQGSRRETDIYGVIHVPTDLRSRAAVPGHREHLRGPARLLRAQGVPRRARRAVRWPSSGSSWCRSTAWGRTGGPRPSTTCAGRTWGTRDFRTASPG